VPAGELLPPELLPPEVLPPELLPCAGLDEEPPDEPVVERDLLPLGWLMDEEPELDRLDAPCREVLVDAPVVVRVVVPVLTLTPGLERRCTTVRLATAGRRLWMITARLAGACSATRARLGRFTCLLFLMMVRVAGSPDTTT